MVGEKDITIEWGEKSALKYVLGQKKFSAHVLLAIFIATAAILLGLYHMFAAKFGQPEAHIHRSLHLNIVLILAYIIWPTGRKSWKDEFNWYFFIDCAVILFVMYSAYYTLHDIDEFNFRIGSPANMDVVMGFIYMMVVFEATRRVVGWPMVACAAFFLIHALYSPYFPGVLYGPPTPLTTTFAYQFMADEGIFGIPIMASSSFVVLFMIFGSLLFVSGAGTFFTEIAFALTGARTAGPAKSAIVASGMMGTISGSTAANVVTTGSFTIPLMKRLGYTPAFAGAVEAAASSGGQIMPPVMGASAFIMALFLGIPYLSVCIAAFIPAVLYFVSLFAAVHFEAKRLNLKTMDKSELPDWRRVLRKGWLCLVPLVTLVIVLVLGYTAMMAAFWSIIAGILVSFVDKQSRMGPVTLLTVFELGAIGVVIVGVACACAGVVIGAVTDSGLGVRMSNVVIAAGQGKLWLALIMTMFASIVLGMGLTTTAVYITLAVLVIPALVALGVVPIAAHMFAFYFGVIGCVTPPVAMAAFAAAGVAGSKPMETGWTATRIAITAFIVPFMFVYNPELLWIGSLSAILISFCTAIVGVVILSSSVIGWLYRKTYLLERVILFIAAMVLIKPGLMSDLIGVVCLGVVLLTQKMIPAKREVL